MRCDCHVHVVGPIGKYPQIPERTYTAEPAPLETLRALGDQRSIDRFVIVQPSFYGADNSMLMDALASLEGRGRAVAVIEPSRISNARLHAMNAAGVRGLRANLYSPLTGKEFRGMDNTLRDLEAIAWNLDWHIEIIAPIATLTANVDLISRSRVPVVIDHYGLYGNARPDDSLGRVLLELAGLPHVWVKLSAPYRHDKGPLNIEPDRLWMSALLDAAPDRCVWGSDWPNPPPHDAHRGADVPVSYRALAYADLVDRFIESVHPVALVDSILTANANRLYQF